MTSNQFYEPMDWKEFLDKSEDYQQNYLTFISDSFECSGNLVAAAMGAPKNSFHRRARVLGVKFEGKKGPRKNDDAFLAWWNGIPAEFGGAVEDTAEPAEVEEVKTIAELPGRKLAPLLGHMTLCGTPAEIGETIASFLGNECIKCEVTWEVL